METERLEFTLDDLRIIADALSIYYEEPAIDVRAAVRALALRDAIEHRLYDRGVPSRWNAIRRDRSE